MKVDAKMAGDIALGGAFLATGGGGDILVGRLTTQHILRTLGAVELVPLNTIDDAATVIAVGGVGAPTILQEKASNGLEPLWALEALEAHIGRKADALIAFEAGGLNALVPFIPAAQRGLPVVDADGMGRALPELQMETFSIYGIKATPLSIAGDLGDRAIIETRDSFVAEKLVRQFAIIAGGGHCASAEHVMTGAEAKRVAVPGTISLCAEIGAALRHYRGKMDACLDALSAILDRSHYGVARTLFRGKVVDVDRRIEGGFDVGAIALESFGDSEERLNIEFRNEYLVARRNDRVVATVPDLICIIDNESAQPITAETIRYGQRVCVLGIGAPPIMRTPEALEVLAPRCFGFDIDFVPIEELG